MVLLTVDLSTSSKPSSHRHAQTKQKVYCIVILIYQATQTKLLQFYPTIRQGTKLQGKYNTVVIIIH